MSESVYDDVMYTEEILRRNQMAVVLDSYVNAEDNGSSRTYAEIEDSNTTWRQEVQHTGGHTAWSRCYRLTEVCVLLLCVLLLTATTVLWIKYNMLSTENQQLQASYQNLTTDRNQLQMERDVYLRTFHDLDKARCFNSSLYLMSNEEKSWNESRNYCRERGTDLVIINSKSEQEFIVKMLSSRRAWIGLTDRDNEGMWKWVDNTNQSTGFWYQNEPNSASGEEDCVVTGYMTDPVWNWADYPCNTEFMWICEKSISN